MKTIHNLILLASAALMFGCANRGDSHDWYQYGERFPTNSRVYSVNDVKGGEKDIIVEGRVGEVCITMGCWLTLHGPDGQQLFVQTRDHAFFVPRNAAGRMARVHGWAERAKVGVDQLKHFAEDAGRSVEEIAAIDKPIERITFHADSVIIEGDGLELAEPPVDR